MSTDLCGRNHPDSCTTGLHAFAWNACCYIRNSHDTTVRNIINYLCVEEPRFLLELSTLPQLRFQNIVSNCASTCFVCSSGLQQK